MAVSTRGALVAMMLIFAVLLTAHTGEAAFIDCRDRYMDYCLNVQKASKAYCYTIVTTGCLLNPTKARELKEMKLRSPMLKATTPDLESSSKH